MTATTSTPMSKTRATYFVVPVVPAAGSTENVKYFEDQPGKSQWKSISAKGMNTRGQGHPLGDTLDLNQPDIGTILEKSGLPPEQIDRTATLFAAVARTLAAVDDLPCVFQAADGAVTIPVKYQTVRGVILVFMRTAEIGDGVIEVTQLIASTDPEIKNSTGTED